LCNYFSAGSELSAGYHGAPQVADEIRLMAFSPIPDTRVEADLAYYGGEIERLKIEVRRCNKWHEANIRNQIAAANDVLKALLTLKLYVNGGR
jgi:hypothetical protein